MQDLKKGDKSGQALLLWVSVFGRKNFKGLIFKILNSVVIGSLFHGPKRQFRTEALCFL